MAASNGHRRWHGMWCASFFSHFSIWRGSKNSESQRASAAARASTATPTALPHATCGVICTLTLTHSHTDTHTRYAPTFVAGTLTQFLCSGRCAALAAPPFVHPCTAPPRPSGSMLEFCRLVFLSLGDAAAKCQEVNT